MSPRKRSGTSLLLGAIIVSGALGGVIYFSAINNLTQTPTQGFVLHWRVNLNITDLSKPPESEKVTVPGKIGVRGGLWANHTLDIYGGSSAPLHTDNENGTIQIELTRVRPTYPFTLGDFFFIWGVPLNNTCVYNYCSSQNFPFMETTAGGLGDTCINTAYPLYDGDYVHILIGGQPLDALSCV